jgi:hypothetical protein
MSMLDLGRAFPKRTAKCALERVGAIVTPQVQLSLSEISKLLMGHGLSEIPLCGRERILRLSDSPEID